MVQTFSIAQDAKRFDEVIEQCLRALAGGVLDSKVFRELQIPVKPNDPKKPSRRIGFASAKDIAAAAVIPFSSAASLISRAIFSALVKPFVKYESALHAHRKWSLSYLHSSLLPLSAFCSTKTISKHILTEGIHEAVQKGSLSETKGDGLGLGGYRDGTFNTDGPKRGPVPVSSLQQVFKDHPNFV